MFEHWGLNLPLSLSGDWECQLERRSGDKGGSTLRRNKWEAQKLQETCSLHFSLASLSSCENSV